MATYFHGSSEIQAHDGLQTLYLMNPNNLGYSDTQPPANMLFLSSGNTMNSASISHTPPPQNQNFLPVPLQATTTVAGSANSANRSYSSLHSHHEIPTLHGVVPRFHYNLWGSSDQIGSESHPHIPTPSQRGLSLSLSSRQPTYRPISREGVRGSGGSSSSVSMVSNGISGMQSVILGSKYLKFVQQLLDEVVNVGLGTKIYSVEGIKEKVKMNEESKVVNGSTTSGGEGCNKLVADQLTTAQRQELQMKKTTLFSMLDEVEQRYKHYHHQMQIVVGSFEQAAGFGSAKSYTGLALQTISKQFRCLKDAITSQIKATSKCLSEEEGSLGGKFEVSRLKFVDHYHLRQQQRSLQQFGMIQNNNAWRPQRGLPEKAVSVLRAWLFEHFLHPYPKDSDKHILAKQTGLTRSQVSNWFINARVRLWKPMVEEMYLEETKDQDQNGSKENTTTSEPNKNSGPKSTAPQESNTFQMDQMNSLQSKQQMKINQNPSPTEISNSNVVGSFQADQTAFAFVGSTNMERIIQRNPKKQKGSEIQNPPGFILSMDMDTKHIEPIKKIHEKLSNERQNAGSYVPVMDNTTSHGTGFGTYPIGEIGTFNPEQMAAGFQGNGVSLSLGLPHDENLSFSGRQQNYLSNQRIQLGNRLEMETVENRYSGINTPPQASHSHTDYENINFQKRKRFAAQLLPDFVT